jgi:hypothetical protein
MTTVFADLPMKIDDSNLGEIALTKKERERVCFTKYESHNAMISDTVHHGTWDIVVTSDKRHGDKLGLSEDDGVIINFQGTPRGEVAITSEGSILTDEEADLREEATGQNMPRYMAFDFRIKKLTKTDGPQQREMLMKSLDQRRQDSESTLIETLTAAFQSAAKGLSDNGNMAPSKDELLKAVANSGKSK